MTETVLVKKINETYVKIEASASTIMELSDRFTFDVPGAKFSPAYKNKYWDGKLRLLNRMTGYMYAGLVTEIEAFCQQHDYEIEYDYDSATKEFSVVEALDFIKSLDIPKKFEIRDYQVESFASCVRNGRQLLLSPTSSGKSFIIYLLTRYYNLKTLIIVPRTQLVSQMSSDFVDYGYDADNIHQVYQGQDKSSDKPVTIAIWNSIYKLPKEYFDSFDVVIGDEAHGFKAKVLTSIMEKLSDCPYRFGTTGTLDGSETNALVLQGLFGAIKKVISTTELIEQGYASELQIKAIVLKYPDEVRKVACKLTYPDEMDYLVRSVARNKFILNLAASLKGNTLLLFQYVDKHGKVMYDQLNQSYPDRSIYYVAGDIKGEDRERIRLQIENEENSITVASFGTFSTGVNIKKLHNIIYASPSKAVIRNLQSIGRGLRLHDSKEFCTLYDIADDLSWKSSKNHTLNHFVERMRTYTTEKFKYKIYNVNLNV